LETGVLMLILELINFASIFGHEFEGKGKLATLYRECEFSFWGFGPDPAEIRALEWGLFQN
jgi:hypothetical protein